jgi:hypothetical protein
METLDDTEGRALARSLDCLTEEELSVLAKAEPSTVEAWRKRGKGPDYILFGNRFLYPRKSVSEHLQTLVRERSRGIGAKGLL